MIGREVGGKLQVVGVLTREGGNQDGLNRLVQMKKEERKAIFEALFRMCFF